MGKTKDVTRLLHVTAGSVSLGVENAQARHRRQSVMALMSLMETLKERISSVIEGSCIYGVGRMTLHSENFPVYRLLKYVCWRGHIGSCVKARASIRNFRALLSLVMDLMPPWNLASSLEAAGECFLPFEEAFSQRDRQ